MILEVPSMSNFGGSNRKDSRKNTYNNFQSISSVSDRKKTSMQNPENKQPLSMIRVRRPVERDLSIAGTISAYFDDSK